MNSILFLQSHKLKEAFPSESLWPVGSWVVAHTVISFSFFAWKMKLVIAIMNSVLRLEITYVTCLQRQVI